MSCVYSERKGRFLIQEIDESSNVEHDSIRRKLKRVNSEDQKFIHELKGQGECSEFVCEALDSNLNKFVNLDLIWNDLLYDHGENIDKEVEFFKYYPSSTEEDDESTFFNTICEGSTSALQRSKLCASSSDNLHFSIIHYLHKDSNFVIEKSSVIEILSSTH